MPEILVVNASQLIFLGNADGLDLLRTAGAGRIIVPEPVIDEVIAGGHTDEAAHVVSNTAWLERRPAPALSEAIKSWDLGPGESSVLAVALQLPGAGVAIDDLNGRRCGLSVPLTPKPSTRRVSNGWPSSPVSNASR